MRNILISINILVLSSFFAQPAASAPIETPAQFAVILDYRTGEVLFEKSARIPTAPASMSKLMTAAIVFERLQNGTLSLSDEFAVSAKAWKMGGSKMWVRVDTSIRLEDLLRGIIVQSGNDACIVVAENIAGSEAAFAELMNQKAREWGLTDSTFANATGWPHENQKMSMLDLARLTRKIIRDFGQYYGLFAEREFVWEKIRQSNRNPLLDSFDGADGLKTGRTDESGYGLVGSAVRDGERRIIVINGLESEKGRSREATRLMRIAFDEFERVELFAAGDVVGAAEIFKGKSKTAPLRLAEPVNALAHRTAFDNVRASVVYNGPVAAPIRENQQIGFLRVSVGEAGAREYPLYASEKVGEIGPLGKIGLAARLLLAKPEPKHAEDQTIAPN